MVVIFCTHLAQAAPPRGSYTLCHLAIDKGERKRYFNLDAVHASISVKIRLSVCKCMCNDQRPRLKSYSCIGSVIPLSTHRDSTHEQDHQLHTVSSAPGKTIKHALTNNSLDTAIEPDSNKKKRKCQYQCHEESGPRATKLALSPERINCFSGQKSTQHET